MFMPKLDKKNERLLMHKLHYGGRTNFYEWLENVCDDFCEEQAVEERLSLEEVNRKFYTDLHEGFLCTIPQLLFKLLIENGVGYIVKPRPLLQTLVSSNWQQKKRMGMIS